MVVLLVAIVLVLTGAGQNSRVSTPFGSDLRRSASAPKPSAWQWLWQQTTLMWLRAARGKSRSRDVNWRPSMVVITGRLTESALRSHEEHPVGVPSVECKAVQVADQVAKNEELVIARLEAATAVPLLGAGNEAAGMLRSSSLCGRLYGK